MPSRSSPALARLRHLLVATLLTAGALAQAPSPAEGMYQQAVAEPSGAQRIAALEDVAQTSTGTPFRIDALELLVWEYAHTNPQQAGNAARELLTTDPGNAMAIAVLKSGTGLAGTNSNVQRDAATLEEALQNVKSLHKPQATSEAEYRNLQRWTYALLSGSAGMAYFRAKDYDRARAYLRNGLAVIPNQVAWNYSLGLADLDAKNAQAQVGFQELARAVVLTHGTPEGRAVGRFALERYEAAGGTSADWDRYLAAASATIGNAKSSQALPQIALADFDIPDATHTQPKQARAAAARTAGTARPVKSDKQHEASVRERTDREPKDSVSTPVPEVEQRHVAPFPPGEPVSLGILLEASIKKENREEVVQSLSDVVRRLRPKDEAFVLAFGNKLEFEQDLTQNYRLLERAVDEIKPDSGTALYEAVGFAAGHLKRIAKNRNQVLLVISDGRNSSSRESSFQLASQIDNVKIYCIGVGAEAAENRYALQSLASYTGGQVAFITDPGQFEPALQSLAGVIYGPYSVQQSKVSK